MPPRRPRSSGRRRVRSTVLVAAAVPSLVTALVLGAAGARTAQGATDVDAPEGRSGVIERRDEPPTRAGTDPVALLEELDRRTITVGWDQQPLLRIVNELDVVHGVPITADWTSLERLGVRPRTTVTLRAADASALAVLRQLAVLVGDPFDRATIESWGGRVLLTTDAIATRILMPRAYDVRDLLAREAERRDPGGLPAAGSVPETAPPGAGRGGADAEDETDSVVRGEDAGDAGDAGRAGDPSDAGDADADGRAADARPGPADGPAGASDDDRDGGPGGGDPANAAGGAAAGGVASTIAGPGARLVRMALEHAHPETWVRFGGESARVTERDGVLVVTASATTHRLLETVLEELRRADPRGLVLEASIVRAPAGLWDRLDRRYDPSRTAFARRLLAADGAEVRWRSRSPVIVGGTLRVEETLPGIGTVRLSLAPRRDPEAGGVRLAVDLAWRRATGGDAASEATLVTEVPLASVGGAATIGIPGAGDAGDGRELLLVVLPRRY